MTDNIHWIFEGNLKAEKSDEFSALADEMITQVNENEKGTLGYEWWTNGSAVHFSERFADSAAAIVHLGTFGGFAERFLACIEVTRVSIYGKASDELQGALKDFGPTYYGEQIGPGFTR